MGAKDTSPVTVFIPTLNAGAEFGDVVDAVLSQEIDRDVELLVTDSGSTDETLDCLRKRSIAFDTIDRSDFNHGAVRNRAVDRARGEFVAFLSQDAHPADQLWLARLIEAFDDPTVAGAYSRQIPRKDCHPFQRINLEHHAAGDATDRLQQPLSLDEWRGLAPAVRLDRIAFDDVASAVRREDARARPFPHVSFGEDLAWARSALLAGRAIVRCARSVVIHSHPLAIDEFSRRVFEGHRAICRETDHRPIPSRLWMLRRTAGTCLRFVRAALRAPARTPLQRLTDVVQAPFWAWIQIDAMYRGGRDGRYVSPGGTES